MRRIALTGKYGKGKFALVDDADFESVNGHKWNLSGEYPVSSFGKRPTRTKVSMHRFIMDAAKGTFVDHRDGNRLDNRRANLRSCTVAQNTMNSRKSKNRSSKFKGVTRNRPWRAYVGPKTIGHFNTEIEAAQAYDAAAKKLYGEFARLNFPITA